MKEVVAMAIVHALTSCGPAFSPVKLEDCYDRAEGEFWDYVEDCKRRGLTGEQCPLAEPMAKLKDAQEACE